MLTTATTQTIVAPWVRTDVLDACRIALLELGWTLEQDYDPAGAGDISFIVSYDLANGTARSTLYLRVNMETDGGFEVDISDNWTAPATTLTDSAGVVSLNGNLNETQSVIVQAWDHPECKGLYLLLGGTVVVDLVILVPTQANIIPEWPSDTTLLACMPSGSGSRAIRTIGSVAGEPTSLAFPGSSNGINPLTGVYDAYTDLALYSSSAAFSARLSNDIVFVPAASLTVFQFGDTINNTYAMVSPRFGVRL